MAHDKVVHHPIFARFLDRLAEQGERKGQGDHRREMLAGLSGRVVELGAGNGINFKHYPAGITEVVAVEPEPYLRRRAEQQAAQAAVPVTVIDALAGQLPLEDGSFDAAVASLVLCTVPDPHAALADLFRLVRPGGELRFYEHVRANTPGLARVQDALAPIWPFFGGGCHPNRETTAAIEDAGFHMEQCRRFPFRPSPICAPVAPHVIGIARRPSA